jgi:hypothetical protein
MTNLSFSNHNSSRETRQWDGNAFGEMNSTVRGITINWSDEYENTLDSIRVNREFDSNESDESE